jgi:Secretion system C-terminal sorting domain
MKLFFTFLIFIFFANISVKAQIIAGDVPLGYTVVNMNYVFDAVTPGSLFSDTTLNFDCDTAADFYHFDTLNGSGRYSKTIQLDTSISIYSFSDFNGNFYNYYVDSSALISDSNNNTVFANEVGMWDNDTISHHYPYYNFINKYLPIKKKYNANTILFGWMKMSVYSGSFFGGNNYYLHSEIKSYTKFPKYYTPIYDTILCNGNYTFTNNNSINNITQDTIYAFVMAAIDGCDSLVKTFVHVLPINTIMQYDTIGFGCIYHFVDGVSIKCISNTTHTSILRASGGCDSVIQTYVFTRSPFQKMDTLSFCEGDSIVLIDGYKKLNILLTDSMANANYFITKCDTIFSIYLQVHPRYFSIIYDTIGSGCIYFFSNGGSSILSNDTMYKQAYFSKYGCDSTKQYLVHIKPQWQVADTIVICENDYVTFMDGTQLFNVMLTDSFANHVHQSFFCDTIYNTFLSVMPIYNYADTIRLCAGQSYLFPEGLYLSSVSNDTIIQRKFATQFTCDSTMNTTIILYPLLLASVQSFQNCFICNNANVNYQWLNCTNNQLMPNEKKDTLFVENNNSYAVIISDSFCTDTSACLTVNNANAQIRLHKIMIDIYPNPASTILHINGLNNQMYKYKIINSTGKIMIDQDLSNNIDIHLLPIGIYHISIFTKDGIYSPKKFIKN